ncbi:MAG: threonine synthase, partial [Desulfurococcales archaeon]|nr:threonine synthase [Desulfurococcales archaeon]
NTSSSMAAYAARAGLKAVIVLPEGKVAKGKVSQAILHGATIINVRGNFDLALSVVREIGRKGIAYVMNSVNPWRLEGQKTVGFEIVEEIGIPDWIVLPVGNAGNISALWKGLKELAEAGLIDKLPRIAGIQALGASPLAQAFKNNRKTPEFIDNPETIASAIRIGKPVSWKRAMKAVEESGGVFESVTDREILEAQKNLARKEGLGVEPASAAAYAGAMKLVETSIIDKDDKIAIIATGHALKDPDIAGSHEVVKYSADPESIERIILNITSK